MSREKISLWAVEMLVATAEEGAITAAARRLGVSASAVSQQIAGLEAALSASFTPDAVAGVATDEGEMSSDLHGSAAYRAHLVGVMAQRAVAQALA